MGSFKCGHPCCDQSAGWLALGILDTQSSLAGNVRKPSLSSFCPQILSTGIMTSSINQQNRLITTVRQQGRQPNAINDSKALVHASIAVKKCQDLMQGHLLLIQSRISSNCQRPWRFRAPGPSRTVPPLPAAPPFFSTHAPKRKQCLTTVGSFKDRSSWASMCGHQPLMVTVLRTCYLQCLFAMNG